MQRKVLIIVENLPVPFDTRVWKEATSLRENGYDVTVLCPKGRGYEAWHEVLDGVRIYRHPAVKEGKGVSGYLFEYGSALLWEFFFAWWIFVRHGFDVIQGCNPPDTVFMVVLPFKLFGVRYIFDHHDANPELYLSKFGRRDFLYRIQLWLERMTYRTSNVVMTTNSSYRHLALTRGDKNPDDIFIVRNGPDLRSFKPVAPNPAMKRGKLFLVGYVGTMNMQDGLDLLLDVAQTIRNAGRTDIHFTCVGGGPDLLRLKAAAHDKGLDGTVTFTGRVPTEELIEVLSTADVCVNPDRPCEMNNISTMIKIMEYMSLGKPIVQFDLREGRFSAQDASLYADTTSGIADFAAKLLWLLDHPRDRALMGEFGQRRVAEQLAWEYSVPQLLAAYVRALTHKPRPQAVVDSAPSDSR